MVPIVAGAVALTVLLGIGALLTTARGRDYQLGQPDETDLYVTSGPALRRLTVGYSALAADLYWIRAIQYFGSIRLKLDDPTAPKDYSQLYPLLDLTTSLDPYFSIAYRFGSIFLAEPAPGGAGRPDLAVALLEKGLRESPDKWEYAEDIGFVHYWWSHDYQQAAQWFDRASTMPNAPWWLRSLSATTLLRGGDRESSRRMWQSIHDAATDNEWLRGSAERALRQLAALDQIDQLQPIVDRLVSSQQRPVPAGTPLQLDGRVVVDPTGVPYEIDAGGKLTIGRSSSLLPLPAAVAPGGAPRS